jgi:hypothetical protein
MSRGILLFGGGGVVAVGWTGGGRAGPATWGCGVAVAVVEGSAAAVAVAVTEGAGGGGAGTVTVTVTTGAAAAGGGAAGRPTRKNAATAPIAAMLAAPTARSSALDARAGAGMVAATPRVVGSGGGALPGWSAVMVPVAAGPGTIPTTGGTCAPLATACGAYAPEAAACG